MQKGCKVIQPDKLFSIKELEQILPDNDIRGYDKVPYPLSHVLVRQLLEAMRENDKYEELLQKYMLENAELRRCPLKLICEKCAAPTDIDNPNKDSNNLIESLRPPAHDE